MFNDAEGFQEYMASLETEDFIVFGGMPCRFHASAMFGVVAIDTASLHCMPVGCVLNDDRLCLWRNPQFLETTRANYSESKARIDCTGV